MGTIASVRIASRVDGGRALASIAACQESLKADERRFSHFSRHSEISRRLRGEAIPACAQREIDDVLEACHRLEIESGGVFKATNPTTGAVDTAGFVKGYSMGKAAERMHGLGVHDFVLSVGGDTACAGSPDGQRPWRVAVVDPRALNAVAAILEVEDASVATSGTAERGEHIWCFGKPVRSPLLSFTVTGPDISRTDAYATIGFAMGEAGIEWVTDHAGYSSIALGLDGTLRGDAQLVRGSSRVRRFESTHTGVRAG
jgi:thiamine biosynthesis lipoprotein